MKNIIVFIEPQVESYFPCFKLAYKFFNRVCIDEDAAFELLGVYYLRKCSNELFNKPKTEISLWNEARLAKGWNTQIHTQKLYENGSYAWKVIILIFFSEKYDFGIINAAIAKIPKNHDTTTHFISASLYYYTNEEWKRMLSGLCKHRIKSALLTIFYFARHRLVTKEDMMSYYKGEYIYAWVLEMTEKVIEVDVVTCL